MTASTFDDIGSQGRQHAGADTGFRGPVAQGFLDDFGGRAGFQELAGAES
ncbi:hypothetical protein [Mycobacterium marinum]